MGCNFPTVALSLASLDFPTATAPALPKLPSVSLFVDFGLPLPPALSLASLDFPTVTPPALPKLPPLPPIDITLPTLPALSLASIDFPTLTPPKLPIMPTLPCPFDDVGGQ